MSPRPLAAAALALVLAAQALPSSAAGFPNRFPPVSANPANRLAPETIDDYRYDHARRCRKQPTPGARSLEAWLQRHAAGESWGIMRCEKLSRRHYSLHAEGRALDWHLDSRRPAERRAGRRLISLLLAEDRFGNPHALARRMGIQEIIWDCKSWWSGSPGLEGYSACFGKRGKRRRRVDATTAHRDHIHIGLNWPGARKRTTFWR
jgi:hypothetical protein